MNRTLIESSIAMIEDLVLFQFQSGNGSIRNDPMLSNYFIRAFLSIGNTTNCKPLADIKKWYTAESHKSQHLDPFLLEGLIMLGMENSPYVKEKIEELISVRYKKGKIELPTGYIMQGDLFSTMFCLRIIFYLSAWDNFGTDRIEQSLEWVIKHRDEINLIKDKPLPVYLLTIYDYDKYSDKIVLLIDEQKEGLNNLKEIFNNNINENNQKAVFSELENILWTIYDLLPLIEKNEYIATYLKDFFDSLIKFFDLYYIEYIKMHVYNESAQYNKTRTYSLFLTIFSNYYGTDFQNKIKDEYLNISCRENISSFIDQQNKMIEPFEHTIKRWLAIKFQGIFPLRGGYSGSEIVRIKSDLEVPVNNQTYPLPGLICKISDQEDFNKELENYKNIPVNLKQYFSRLSNSIKSMTVEDQSKVFLIMEDLSDYLTLREIFDSGISDDGKIDNILKDYLHYVCNTLKFIYSSSKNTKAYNPFMMYSEDIFKSIAVISKVDVYEGEKVTPTLLSISGLLTKSSPKYELNSTTLMHGDLNLRNIMISSDNDEFKCKLIDVDSLNNYGDYVYDAGELMVDIEASYNSTEVLDIVEKEFKDLSKMINDSSFSERLVLSKFRSWLRLAKININRGDVETSKSYIDKGIELFKE